MSALIEVSHLSKRFSSFEAVRDLSFTVNEGDVFGFLGQNGAGKSTTIRMLLTLVRPSEGEICIFGKDLIAHRGEILGRTGAVIEQPDLYPYLSGYDNLRLFARMGGKDPGRMALMDRMERVGLAGRANDPVRAYSQGMKQRLGIAVALVQDPALVILDEPTNGLDPQGIVDIRNLILRLNREEGKTFLVSSHLLGEVELVASRMLIIDRGRKVVEGSVRELINPERVMLELEATDIARAQQCIGQSQWSSAIRPAAPGRIMLDLSKAEVPLLAGMLVHEGIGLTAMRPANTLEAYFLSLTKSPGNVEPG
jgi:ABC-type multidrug transport system ATPase subunit